MSAEPTSLTSIDLLMEVTMSDRDEAIRTKLFDRLTAVGVDARNLKVDVDGGLVAVQGAVPSEDERRRAVDALIGVHTLEISVRPSEPD
jgi:osmotically-inducible protein OsmY